MCFFVSLVMFVSKLTNTRTHSHANHLNLENDVARIHLCIFLSCFIFHLKYFWILCCCPNYTTEQSNCALSTISGISKKANPSMLYVCNGINGWHFCKLYNRACVCVWVCLSGSGAWCQKRFQDQILEYYTFSHLLLTSFRVTFCSICAVRMCMCV